MDVVDTALETSLRESLAAFGVPFEGGAAVPARAQGARARARRGRTEERSPRVQAVVLAALSAVKRD